MTKDLIWQNKEKTNFQLIFQCGTSISISNDSMTQKRRELSAIRINYPIVYSCGGCLWVNFGFGLSAGEGEGEEVLNKFNLLASQYNHLNAARDFKLGKLFTFPPFQLTLKQ